MFSDERERIEVLIPREFGRLFHAGRETVPGHDRFDFRKWIAPILPGIDERRTHLRAEPNFIVDRFALLGKARSYLFFDLVKKLPISRSLRSTISSVSVAAVSIINATSVP
jgi:hypothetical protein